MAKKHELKELLSHEAITKAVDSIWEQTNGITWKLACLRLFCVPKYLFMMNVLADFLFFMLLSLMMLTGMCVKGKDE